MIILKRKFNDIVVKELRGKYLLKYFSILKRFNTSIEFINYLKRMLDIQDNEVYEQIVGGYFQDRIKESGSFIN
jgi:hypothetical protein